MRRTAGKGISLKWGLIAIMAFCWLVPVIVILLYSSYSISNNVRERIRDTVVTSVGIAIQSVESQLDGAMDASRAPSYDDTVKNAYTRYQNDGDSVALYDSVTAYLNQQYGYDEKFNATFLFFTAEPNTLYYASNRTDSGRYTACRTTGNPRTRASSPSTPTWGRASALRCTMGGCT
jgi:two-component system sensor histidine kinase YesM